jgi:hypothetical protein
LAFAEVEDGHVGDVGPTTVRIGLQIAATDWHIEMGTPGVRGDEHAPPDGLIREAAAVEKRAELVRSALLIGIAGFTIREDGERGQASSDDQRDREPMWRHGNLYSRPAPVSRRVAIPSFLFGSAGIREVYRTVQFAAGPGRNGKMAPSF